MKLEMVEWVDARFIEGWYERTGLEHYGTIKCVTVGVLVKETQKEIIVAGHRNEEHISGAMAIPKACISRRRELTVK